jgi:hypothetical protein
MPAPVPELADIFRQHGPAYRRAHAMPLHHHKLMQAVEACRTPALGGVVEWCPQCQRAHTRYRSCRNRHCPKCQGTARLHWLEARKAELLPVEYFHVVFTVPAAIAELCLRNKEIVYGILFRVTAETLLTIARDPKRLNVETGFFAVLHSWGQNLHFHPHLHCVVPGGGLSRDGTRWINGRRRFFLPVRVLSALFRRLFLQALEQAFEQGQILFPGTLSTLSKPAAFRRFLARTARSQWVVYAKAPFGGAEHVLEYLGRYTHRVAISNRRIVALENGNVSFRWKDYRDPNHQQKIVTVSAEEFIGASCSMHSHPVFSASAITACSPTAIAAESSNSAACC